MRQRGVHRCLVQYQPQCTKCRYIAKICLPVQIFASALSYGSVVRDYIVGVSASSTAYFVANVMKDNYMNGLRAGLEISGLMTRVEERKKIFYNQVPEQQTKIKPANENARLEN